MPGVNVTTATQVGSSAPIRAASGQAFFVGLAERGQTTAAVLLRSFADYTKNFGSRVSYGYLYDTVKTFFDEGGEQCYIARAVGPAATKGTVTVNDTAGTPVPTVKFDANNAGSWSANVNVIVADGALANTKKVSTSLNGTVVESYDNLADPSAIAAAFTKSPYVVATNLGSASAAPTNLPANGTYALSAGDSDRANVTPTQYTAALTLFTQGLGDGAVAAPGLGASIHSAVIDHCKANRRIALLSLDQSSTAADLKSAAAGLNTEYAGLFGPWVYVNDGAGGLRACPPDGFVAATRSRAHVATGPWRAGAGEIAKANTLAGLVTEWQRDVTDDLDSSRVNALRIVQQSIRVYGWRSLSTDTTNYKFLTARDTLNRIVVQAEEELEAFTFTPIDAKGQALSSINAQLVGIVEPMRAAGGIYEKIDPVTQQQVDKGYRVDTDSVNTQSTAAADTINANLYVRVAPLGAQINLLVTKVGILSGV